MRIVLVGRASSPEEPTSTSLPIRRGGSASATLAVTTLDEIPSWSQAPRRTPKKLHSVTFEASWAENEEKPSIYASALR